MPCDSEAKCQLPTQTLWSCHCSHLFLARLQQRHRYRLSCDTAVWNPKANPSRSCLRLSRGMRYQRALTSRRQQQQHRRCRRHSSLHRIFLTQTMAMMQPLPQLLRSTRLLHHQLPFRSSSPPLLW